MVKTFVTFIAVVLTIVIVSYFISKWMVKNHIFLAKKIVIGRESKKEDEKMIMVASQVLDQNTIFPELLEKDSCTISTTVEEGRITMVKVENERVEVLLTLNNRNKVILTDKAFDESTATLIVAAMLVAYLLLFIAICLAIAMVLIRM